jgi:hypothetical protein
MRHFFLLLLSLYLPLCATEGADGISPPGVVDFAHQHFHWNKTGLAAPAGMLQQPNFTSPEFGVPPAALFTAVQTFIASQPRSYALDVEPGQLQAAWVIRSHLCNFPDVIEIAVVPAGAGHSSIIISSHAI